MKIEEMKTIQKENTKKINEYTEEDIRKFFDYEKHTNKERVDMIFEVWDQENSSNSKEYSKIDGFIIENVIYEGDAMELFIDKINFKEKSKEKTSFMALKKIAFELSENEQYYQEELYSLGPRLAGERKKLFVDLRESLGNKIKKQDENSIYLLVQYAKYI